MQIIQFVRNKLVEFNFQTLFHTRYQQKICFSKAISPHSIDPYRPISSSDNHQWIHIPTHAFLIVHQPTREPTRIRVPGFFYPKSTLHHPHFPREHFFEAKPPRYFSTNARSARNQHIFPKIQLLFLLAAAFCLGLSSLRIKKEAEANEDPLYHRKLARALKITDLSIEETDEQTQEKCFNKLYDHCKKKEWDKLKEAIVWEGAEKIRNSRGQTLFLKMVEEGDITCLTPGFPIDWEACDAYGNNGLMIASHQGHFSFVKHLLATNRYSTETKNNEGKTVLHLAIEKGHLEVAKLLYNEGAHLVDWQSPHQQSLHPIVLAVESGNRTMVDFIFDLDPKACSHANSHQILHRAIKRRDNQMVEHLLTAHYQQTYELLYKTDEKIRTPLHLAAKKGELDTIRFLIRYRRVDVNQVVSEIGQTPLFWAAHGEQLEAIRLLECLGANLILPNKQGINPLGLLKNRKTPKSIECCNYLERLINIRKSSNPMISQPENLVFRGGGIKLYSCIGVQKVLEEAQLLPFVTRVAGTSAGALFAALVATGCTSQEIQKKWNQITQDIFFDPIDELAKDMLDSMSDSMILGYNWLLSSEALFHPFTFAQKVEERLMLSGLCAGNKWEALIEEFIQSSTGIENCTFQELQNLVIKNPEKYKDLFIYAIQIKSETDTKLTCFSHEDDVWKHAVISSAIRASTSIPGIHIPAIIRIKEESGEVIAKDHLGYFIDSGLIKNLPIDAFDSPRYQTDSFSGKKINFKTIGISFSDTQSQNKSVKTSQSEKPNVLRALFSILMHNETMNFDFTGEDIRVLTIPVKLNAFDFELYKKKQNKLVKAGYQAACKFFNYHPPTEVADRETGE